MNTIIWRKTRFTRSLLPIGALLLLGLMWGGAINSAKYVAKHNVSPFNYTFWVLIVACVVLIAISIFRRSYPPMKYFRYYFLCGLLGLGLPQFFMYSAVNSIPAGLMTLLIAMTPIVTYIIAMMLRAEQSHYLKTIGVIFGFSGAALILVPSFFGEISIPISGILIGLLAPTSYASFIACSARYRPVSLDMMQLSTGMTITGAATLFVVVTATDSIYPLWNHLNLVSALIVYHGVVTAIAYTIMFALVKHAGPLFASQSTYFVTLFGIAIGAYVHHEILPFLIWLAAAFIFVGLGFIQRARRLIAM